jgi:hypothetical protein
VYSANIPLDQFPYAGWVPTANGRLSFRQIGESKHPTESIYANITTGKGRMVLAYQHRPLSDVLFQSIIHYLCNISGRFWFVLAARSDEEPSNAEEMQGFIGIYKSRDDWRRHENAVRDSIQDINSLRFSLENDRDSVTERAFSNAQAHVNETADIRIAFHIFRSGEVYFSEPSFRDANLAFASNDYADKCGHNFPKWVADQSYFFLRDIAHFHQHHAPSSDTILILQRRDEADQNWRKRIIFSLYHQVIKAKRFGDAPSAYQSLGIQAYCMSFKRICSKSPGWSEDHLRFNDSALKQSLEAKAQEGLARLAETAATGSMNLARAANWRTFALALVAIAIAGLAMLVQPRVNAEDAARFPHLHAWSDFASEHFDTVVAVCLIAILVVWMLTHTGWAIKLSFSRDLLELSNVRRPRFIKIYFSTAIVGLAATLWIARPALYDITDAAKDFWHLFF